MFLLKIPGGLFGVEIEYNLLSILQLSSRVEQCDAIYRLVLELFMFLCVIPILIIVIVVIF